MCGYCDFFKSVKLQQLPQVLDAMEQELVSERNYLSGQPVRTIYFGGGTPSLVEVDRIRKIIEIIALNYDVSSLSEVTIEVNPDDISLEYLLSLREAGINRLSIGIQSFDDSLLRFMNRRHNGSQAIEAVRMAQSAGFNNITIDLIFGVDGFGEDILRRSIATALSLGVQHISAYHLTIESGTAFARNIERGAMKVVSDEVSQAEYKILEQELTAAGFEHYEVSNYALPTYRSQHNSSYWKGVHYLGIGPAAHSFDGTTRRYAVSSIESYIEAGADRYEVEELSQRDRYNEFVMTSLRCCEGIDLQLFESSFPPHLIQSFEMSAESWLQKGSLRSENGFVYIPTRYFMISDLIIESLFVCAD